MAPAQPGAPVWEVGQQQAATAPAPVPHPWSVSAAPLGASVLRQVAEQKPTAARQLGAMPPKKKRSADSAAVREGTAFVQRVEKKTNRRPKSRKSTGKGGPGFGRKLLASTQTKRAIAAPVAVKQEIQVAPAAVVKQEGPPAVDKAAPAVKKEAGSPSQ